jgi:hypothetical protein
MDDPSVSAYHDVRVYHGAEFGLSPRVKLLPAATIAALPTWQIGF